MTQTNPLEIALAHHLAGRVREAEAIYRQVLAQNPGAGAANYLLGVAAHQTGRPAEALALLDKASKILPGAADVWNYFSIALR
ncbi:MAG: hypothetical protein QOF78_2658, partial [Phycisphaerales bacterium]|nr:hypothetical protein [Phycisphaerales bacterium]